MNKTQVTRIVVCEYDYALRFLTLSIRRTGTILTVVYIKQRDNLLCRQVGEIDFGSDEYDKAAIRIVRDLYNIFKDEEAELDTNVGCSRIVTISIQP